jgi:hypothetical protein
VRGAIAANQLRGSLIPIADARKRRDAHGRADDTGPGRGCATALSSALAARMYLKPELHAELCLHIGGSPVRTVLMALCTSVVLDAVDH